MYAAIRCYRVNADVCDEVIREIRQSFGPLIESVPGYLAYYVLDTGEGRFATVSIFRGQAGVEDSHRMAAEWMTRYLTERITAHGRIPRFFVEVEETLEGPIYGSMNHLHEEALSAGGGSKHRGEEARKPQDGEGLGLLTVEEVCEELGMGKSWVYRKIWSGEIPSIKLGRRIRVRREDLETYLERLRQ